jgi:hypothetical protein
MFTDIGMQLLGEYEPIGGKWNNIVGRRIIVIT